MMRKWKSWGAWLAVVLTCALLGAAQTGVPPGDPGMSAQGSRSTVNLFGGGVFPGGYLKYTYTVTRQGAAEPSTTTTEIIPLPDGNYSVVSTSTETVSLAMVNIGFFGIPLPRLGIQVAANTSGTIDLSPLSNIAATEIEPGKNYILPDGGRFRAGEMGTIAGIRVIHGTYTHADYTNVEIDLALAEDLTIRALLPFPAKMVFRYSAAASATGDQPLQMFSSVEISEFIYKPTGDR